MSLMNRIPFFEKIYIYNLLRRLLHHVQGKKLGCKTIPKNMNVIKYSCIRQTIFSAPAKQRLAKKQYSAGQDEHISLVEI